MDIQTLVKTVNQTFEDAAQLVKRIQAKRDGSDAPALPQEPTEDLLNSLALGPVIVRGHYDHDKKRFGEAYACGDILAREQMKDVLINLQMALITGLNHVWMDDGDIDYEAMQTVSDDCRVNAGVCLGQLSQRLSDAVKAQSMYSQNTGRYPPGVMLAATPTLQYSSSRSTNSSGFSRAQTMTASTTLTEDFGNMKMQPQSLLTQQQLRDRTTSMSSSSSHDQSQRWAPLAQRPTLAPVVQERGSSLDFDEASLRRPSSTCLAQDDTQLLSPSAYDKSIQSSPRPYAVEPNGTFMAPQQGTHQLSTQMSRRSSAQQSSNGADLQVPDNMSSRAPSRIGINDYPSYATHWEARQGRSPLAQQSYRGITSNTEPYSTMEHVQYLQQNARPPAPDASRYRSESRTVFREPQYDARNPPPHGVQRLQHPTDQQSQRQPTDYYARSSVSGPILAENQNYSNSNYSQSNYSQSVHSARHGNVLPKPSMMSLAPSNHAPSNVGPTRTMSMTSSITSSLTGPLTLPTDKNHLGFCKGAFRLFIGLEKKAFTINNRPLGVSGLLPYWKCEKCTFEGPCVINTLPGQKYSKADKTYDPKVRECPGSGGSGVLYKWAFLAKCHVATKAVPEAGSLEQKRGEYGSFGCIFCACEAQRRGWALSGNDIYTAANDTHGKKNKKGHNNAEVASIGSGGGTPIFGNVQSFMEHLQVHRREEMKPGVEMCGRMKAIVGRAPEEGEEFDLCLLPL